MFKPELSRCDRMYNVAVAVLEFARDVGDDVLKHVSCCRIRRKIRVGLGLPELCDEAFFGDLRAHGDVVGGHGLHLETVMKNKKRYVSIVPGNIKVCLKLVDDVDSGRFGKSEVFVD